MLVWIIGFLLLGSIVIYFVQLMIWSAIAFVVFMLFVLGVVCVQAAIDQHNLLMYLPAAVFFYFVYLAVLADSNKDND